MKVVFDSETDILRIVFRDVPIKESDEEKPGIIFDYDNEGMIVGVEILDATKQKINPRSIEYSIVEKANTIAS